MTVYFDRGRGAWRYDFYLDGRRHTGYCIDPETKQPAAGKREAAAIQEAMRRAVKRAPTTPIPATSSEWTLAEGFADWSEKVASHKRNWPTVKSRVAELLAQLGPSLPLAEINESVVWDYIAWARRQRVRIYLGSRKGTGRWRDTDRQRSDSTINRYVAALRAMLNHAHRQRDPVSGHRRLIDVPDLPELDEPADLPNPVRSEHAKAILEQAPAHLYDGIVLAVHTGLRLREIVRLEIRQVDLQNRTIVLDSRSKAKRGAVVQVNETVYQLLAALIEAATEAKQTRLILYRGPWGRSEPRPIASFRTAWQAAQRRAGISPLYRFHDLRGNFATELARRGAHWKTVQGLARHADIRTTLRYVAVVDDDRRAAVETLSAWEGTQAERRSPPAEKSPGKSPTRNSHTSRRGPKRKNQLSI